MLFELIVGRFGPFYRDSGFIQSFLNLDQHVSYFLVSHICFWYLREGGSVELALAFFFIELALEDFECFLHLEFKEEVAHELISRLSFLILQVGCYDFAF